MPKKKHIVMARSEAAMKKGVMTSKGRLSFKGQSMMTVDDDIADEIDKTDGLKGTQDVWVHEDPRRNWTERYKSDGVHSYFWGGGSRKYAEGYDRIFKKRKRNKRASNQEAEVNG